VYPAFNSRNPGFWFSKQTLDSIYQMVLITILLQKIWFISFG
jgi:hypothetical protein